MRLGELIKKYREEHGYSLRKFAEISGISNAYLSMLENGRYPSSDRPVVPTLTKLNQIASAMNMRVDDLIATIEDMPISIGNTPAAAALNSEDIIIAIAYHEADSVDREMVRRILKVNEKKDIEEDSAC